MAGLVSLLTFSGPRKRLKARLDELDTQEDGFLDLLGDLSLPRDKLKGKLAQR